jgi:ribonuclease VapC
MVVDSSVLLAVLFNEANSVWAAEQLNLHSGSLRMSTVNLAEVLIRLRDRFPSRGSEFELRLEGLGINYMAPDVAQARLAAEARKKYPLNLGDCFAYALAVVERCGVLTTDQDFRNVGVSVTLP